MDSAHDAGVSVDCVVAAIVGIARLVLAGIAVMILGESLINKWVIIYESYLVANGAANKYSRYSLSSVWTIVFHIIRHVLSHTLWILLIRLPTSSRVIRVIRYSICTCMYITYHLYRCWIRVLSTFAVCRIALILEVA